MACGQATLGTCRPVVVDSGSGTCKVGFAGDDAPRAVFSSVVGRPKSLKVMSGDGCGSAPTIYVGDAVQERRGVLKVEYPIDRGVPRDWDDVELLWRHALVDVLGVRSEERPVLLAEAALSPKASRERALQIFFESLYTPALYLSGQAALSLYASGRTTGVALDCGDGVTDAVPIFEGFAMPHAAARANFGGRDLTEYLVRLLAGAGGPALASSGEREIVRDVKEKCCYVARCPAEIGKGEGVRYELPDGQTLELGAERAKCPEALFRPELLGMEADGLPRMVFDAVQACDIDVRRELYRNVVLSGGSTLFPGFGARVRAELARLVPAAAKVRVLHPDDRHAVFVGGAMLADLDSFTEMCIAREEYIEHGPSIVHRKCFA